MRTKLKTLRYSSKDFGERGRIVTSVGLSLGREPLGKALPTPNTRLSIERRPQDKAAPYDNPRPDDTPRIGAAGLGDQAKHHRGSGAGSATHLDLLTNRFHSFLYLFT